MTRRTDALAACAALALVSGSARAADTCEKAIDGNCDELVDCALGTDATDCRAACKEPWPSALIGPCAHLAAIDSVPKPPAADTGTHGSGGPVGFWSGNLEAKGNKPDSPLVRHFLTYVPPSYDPRVAWPVVYVLGGFTVDMYGLWAYTEIVRAADLNGFIAAFPQQHYYDFGPPIGWVFAWNVFPTDWVGGDWQENPDVDFIRVLTAELGKLYNVDRSRVFASGHSRGAGMSIILAFTLPDTIAGFISESGFVEPNKFDVQMMAYKGTRKIPGVLVHGTEDPDVNIFNSDFTADTLTSLGWVQGQDFLYFRLENVAHEWQPQYNQEIWDFVSARPLPAGAP